MQTPAFENALSQLLELAKKKPIAMMCAEAVPWRCHRSLIAYALTVQGYEVQDIFSVKTTKRHDLNPMAKIHCRQITYPATEASLSVLRD